MSDFASRARPALDNLLRQDEEQLYAEPATRIQALEREPSISGSFAPPIEGQEAPSAGSGPEIERGPA